MIFIDSSYFIAIVRKKDQWHEQTRKIQSQIQNKNKTTSTFVLSETITHIGNRLGGKTGMLVYDYITKNNNIISPDKNLIENAMEKFLMYDGTLSLADVVSLEIMEIEGINTIVSFDSDFDKVPQITRIH